MDKPPEGYVCVRDLPDGTTIGVHPFFLTWGLMTGVDEVGYSGRYCYEKFEECMGAWLFWDGEGDPAGNWIKYKGVGGERLGPGVLANG